MNFRIFSIFSFVLLSLLLNSQQAFANPKYASIIVDAETGKVLRASNANKKLYPASLTKMMTLYMAFEALGSGKARLGDKIRISKKAAGMSPSKIGLPAGATIKFEDAILSLVTKSANDIAVAMAEHLGGTEWKFAQNMTSKARALGMDKTTFKNASGLPDNGQISTARDMAILARALIYNHPQYYHYFSKRNFKYRGTTYNNHNHLMKTYKGMDGIKTGYIHASGFNLVASAVQNNRRLIGVVFGGRTTASRNAHMADILDEGFKLARDLPQTRLASLGGNINKTTSSVSRSDSVPQPAPKPQTMQQVVASVAAVPRVSRPPVESSIVNKVLEQGDADIAQPINRPQMQMALADNPNKNNVVYAPAIPSTKITNTSSSTHNAAQVVVPQANPASKWAIQIGAYSSKAISDQAIDVASKSLPPELRTLAQAETYPLTTGTRIIYRARMVGFDEISAQKACVYIRNCMVIAP